MTQREAELSETHRRAPMDFGELRNDTDFITKSTNLEKSLDAIDEQISAACDFPNYDDLSTEDKVKYDLYLSYSINSLYWMYCKLQAIDASSNPIRNEISRVRQAIVRDKDIYERKTKRPVLDKGAAGRFIRHGLHEKRPTDKELLGPKPKHKRFNEDD
ncbi:nuclear nucleic acid-binding protein C1D-like [Sitodiplosis mosellana]|uniref:nuclear nucleic acid-binding protein C1D-like n=1 Tax=Sitodiplosis mosellana TaxID=263140 RepID=UPI0024439A82|nr:nuclear nucleic acid-binding protein C1D-like [Sitodiplosis mosellana]